MSDRRSSCNLSVENRALARPPMKSAFRSVTPLIPTGDSLAAALAFYTEHLGFSVVWQSPEMAGIRRQSYKG